MDSREDMKRHHIEWGARENWLGDQWTRPVRVPFAAPMPTRFAVRRTCWAFGMSQGTLANSVSGRKQ